LRDPMLVYHVMYSCVCLTAVGWAWLPDPDLAPYAPFWHALLLADLVLSNPSLLNIVRSMTRSGKSILLVALFAVGLVYLFSMIGFIVFRQDFVLEVSLASGETVSESGCDTLAACILTTLNGGMRGGGGVADVMRRVSTQEATYGLRIVYDLAFFFIMIVIVMNMITVNLIDTFADLRKEKEDKDNLRLNNCFICGLSRLSFDNHAAMTFSDHCRQEHSVWSYVYFIILLRTKDSTELTGPESDISSIIDTPGEQVAWFPRQTCLSLHGQQTEESDVSSTAALRDQLQTTTQQVRVLGERLEFLQTELLAARKNAPTARLLGRATPPV
jgi:inositol 1,4,5-triphosphate receptor type 1